MFTKQEKTKLFNTHQLLLLTLVFRTRLNYCQYLIDFKTYLNKTCKAKSKHLLKLYHNFMTKTCMPKCL